MADILKDYIVLMVALTINTPLKPHFEATYWISAAFA